MRWRCFLTTWKTGWRIPPRPGFERALFRLELVRIFCLSRCRFLQRTIPRRQCHRTACFVSDAEGSTAFALT